MESKKTTSVDTISNHWLIFGVDFSNFSDYLRWKPHLNKNNVSFVLSLARSDDEKIVGLISFGDIIYEYNCLETMKMKFKDFSKTTKDLLFLTLFLDINDIKTYDSISKFMDGGRFDVITTDYSVSKFFQYNCGTSLEPNLIPNCMHKSLFGALVGLLKLRNAKLVFEISPSCRFMTPDFKEYLPDIPSDCLYLASPNDSVFSKSFYNWMALRSDETLCKILDTYPLGYAVITNYSEIKSASPTIPQYDPSHPFHKELANNKLLIFYKENY